MPSPVGDGVSPTDPGGIPVLVVSLADATDRRHHMTGQLDALGLAFEFVDAVDGRASMPDGASALGSVLEIGRPMTATEVGCARSHAQAYQRILSSRAPAGVVFEDDLTIAPALGGLLSAIDRLPPDWDLVTLFHGKRAHLTGRSLPMTSEVVVQGVAHALGTQGYIVRDRAATRLRECTEPVRLPADELIFRPQPANLQVYGTVPPLVRDGVFDSQIRSVDSTPTRTPLYGRVASKIYRSLRGVARRRTEETPGYAPRPGTP